MKKGTRQLLSMIMCGVLLITVSQYSPVLAEEGLLIADEEEDILLGADTETTSLLIPDQEEDYEVSDELFSSFEDEDSVDDLFIEDSSSALDDDFISDETEEAVLLLIEGYASVEKGIVIFESIDAADEAMGEFAETAVVYAELFQQEDVPEDDWFQITYAVKDDETDEILTENSFVKRSDLSELSEEELDAYLAQLSEADASDVVDHEGYSLIPTVITYYDAAEAPALPVEEEEETEQLSETVEEAVEEEEATEAETEDAEATSTLTIDQQPSDISVKAGVTATFHVAASGDGLTYQWQTKLNETASWGNTGLGGNKTDTLSFKAPSTYDGRQYRCIVKDSNGNTVTSDAATLTIAVLTITTEPEDVMVTPGSKATFHVAASGTGLKYQWQTKLNESASWGNTGLNGSKTDTLSFNAPSAYNGRQYRCVITDDSGSQVVSRAANLTVSAIQITAQPEDAVVSAGSTASFHVEAAGSGLKYQWQTKLNETADWGNTGLSGSKTDTLSFTAYSAYNGRQYRCIITDASGKTVTSDAAVLTIAAIKITVQPEDQTVKAGTAVSFHVEATGSGLKYQWQTKLNETADWGNTGLSGNKTDTLTFTAYSSYTGRQYRCVVTDGNGNSVPSDAATLTIASIVITEQPQDQVVGAGKKAEFHVAATGSDLTYQWQTKLNETADWGNTGLSGSKTDTLSFTAYSSYAGRQYRCVIKDKNGNTLTSDAAILTISMLKITEQPEDQTVAPAEKVSITVKAEGEGLTYQWQTKLNETANWGNTGLNGNKTDTLSFNAPSAYNGRQYRCIVTDAYGNTVTSDPMTLTVKKSITVNNVVYELIDGRMCVIGYEGNLSSYAVEGVVDGYIVVEIAESAFENNTNLESIDLPDTIEVIGRRAFANCTKLSSMT